jgi:hypothetical protein
MNRRSLGRALLLGVLLPAGVEAFPPYRSTDAETADPWTLEGRLGLLRFRREAGENTYLAPLLRINLGLPHRVELIGELEHEPGRGLSDAALGLKWVPVLRATSVGIEALAPLPTSDSGGVGIEANAIVTHRRGPLRLHLNAGAFADGRPEATERGWKASVLVEREARAWRPGLEVFARRIGSEPLQVLVGPGAIIRLGRTDVRLGVHLGLTDAAADLVTDTWIASKLRIR